MNGAVLVVGKFILVIRWEVLDHCIYRPLHVGVDEVDDIGLWVPLPLFAKFFNLVNIRSFNQLIRIAISPNQFGCILVQNQNNVIG